jgi:putative aldouronate transport system permease protein
MKISRGEKTFQIINYIFLTILGIITLYPLIYVLSASISSPDAVISGRVLLIPKNINFHSYELVLREKGIWIAYANTFYYTIFGTALSMLLTIFGAYALSKKRLMGRSFISFFIAITMWFNAGMIPFYLTIRDLNLLDNRLGIIIGFAITTFNVILLRTFFQSIPESLEEAAFVDGANDLTILTKIYIPLAKPAIATVTLFYAVNRWNGYFWSMILLTDANKIPLQVLLKKLIVQMDMVNQIQSAVDTSNYSNETLIYATIIISIIPVLIFYPYIQKFFVKGVMIGSIKG